MKKITLLIFLLLSFIALAADPHIAFKRMKEGKAIIIDVREADEIKDGMIENAKWFPMSKIDSNKDWKKEFKKLAANKEIYLYCHSGRRAERVKGILNDNGIKSENIGGIEELKKTLPLVHN